MGPTLSARVSVRTQEALKGGHFVDVLSILLRLQRICNHPGLVEPRLPQSSFAARPLQLRLASLVLKALDRDAWTVRRDLGGQVGPGGTWHGSTGQPLCCVFPFRSVHVWRRPRAGSLAWRVLLESEKGRSADVTGTQAVLGAQAQRPRTWAPALCFGGAGAGTGAGWGQARDSVALSPPPSSREVQGVTRVCDSLRTLREQSAVSGSAAAAAVEPCQRGRPIGAASCVVLLRCHETLCHWTHL